MPCSRAAYPGSRCNPLACSVNTRRMYAQGCYPSPRRKSCMQTRLRQRGRKKRGLWGVYWRRGCEKGGAETEAKSRQGSDVSKPRGPQASPSSYICKPPIPAISQNLGRIKGCVPVFLPLSRAVAGTPPPLRGGAGNAAQLHPRNAAAAQPPQKPTHLYPCTHRNGPRGTPPHSAPPNRTPPAHRGSSAPRRRCLPYQWRAAGWC